MAKNNIKEEVFVKLTTKDLWGLYCLKPSFIENNRSYIGKDGRIYFCIGYLDECEFFRREYFENFGIYEIVPDWLPINETELFVIVNTNTCQGTIVKYALKSNGVLYEEETDKLTKRTLAHLLHSDQQELYKELKDTYNKFLDFASEWRIKKLRDVVKDKYHLKGEFVYDEVCGDVYTQVCKKNPSKPITNDNIIVISMEQYYKNI